MDFPENLRYTKTHEWIAVQGGKAKVGVTEYAQKEISDVVFVELPKQGQAVQRAKMAAEERYLNHSKHNLSGSLHLSPV